MKYVVNSIVDLIDINSPTDMGEMMIRVNGFENIKIYEKIARKLTDLYKKSDLKVDIKLARNKWNYFSELGKDSSVLQSMEQNGWIAQEESITHYRNLHQSNVLVLMGTEDEADKGGLLNCFTITPDTLIEVLDGKYHLVFERISEYLDDSEYKYIDKLYKDLFEFIAVDICKLSKFSDVWENHISSIEEFIELFYASLPEWGLPYKEIELPTSKSLNRNENVLRMEYRFISRTMFKNMSITQFKKYQKQIIQYAEQGEEYATNWVGWDSQAIKNYISFSKILEGYIRGENISEYKKLLMNTDFCIVEAILDMKLPVGPKPSKKTVQGVLGEPIKAFTTALLYTLANIKNDDVSISKIEFEVTMAEIVSMYSNVEIDEEKLQLQNTWNILCRHLNGIFEYLNKREWDENGSGIEFESKPKDIFFPSNAVKYIDTGIVKAASSNRTNNKILFTSNCYDENGVLLKKESQDFQWKFDGNSSWLHSFSDLCQQEFCENKGNNYVPITTLKKMQSLLFAKSEDEFFDMYDESDINFEFNLSAFVDSKAIGNAREYSVRFDELGQAFADFAYEVATNGFYNCIRKDNSELLVLVRTYNELGDYLIKKSIPENLKWILDAYIHAFNIEEDTTIIEKGEEANFCIVPPWHPGTLQKSNDQRIFFLDGCVEWWRGVCNLDESVSKKAIEEVVNNLSQMSMIQSSLDIFPSYGQQYFGAISSFGSFSLYGRNDIVNNSRLKDIIHKDAIFDDDFDKKEISQMNDNARMIYGVIQEYVKAFPNTYNNLSIVFVDTSELQPIIAAIYKYIDIVRENDTDLEICIQLKILVKPENKGGRNYLSYWMDEFFSQDSNVNIKTYLNEWRTKADLDKILNGNNDIVFVMDLLKVNSLQFIKDTSSVNYKISDCLFPIVYKPSPVSDTTIKRKIELSQPQFNAAYAHTQVVRYRNNLELIPENKYIAVREVCIDREGQDIVYSLHNKAYWVVCVDSGMDGALLRNDESHKNDYSIIGFSTGKGAYGQYNLTITARKTIIDIIKNRFENRLYQLFLWEHSKISSAAKICMNEASGLDGISLLSAINQKDHNINEFMAYVLTSLREREIKSDSALKIVIHLDSYKHWFNGEIEKDIDDSMSRPDFLVLETKDIDNEKMQLKATIVECKISSVAHSDKHKEKAIGQVEHGLRRLKEIFNPDSKSIKRRYWYAQLYRALAFAQVTFSNDSNEFADLSAKLRSILDGNFEIEWAGEILGYWLDMKGEDESVKESSDGKIKIYDISQKRIQNLLLGNSDASVEYVFINETNIVEDETQDNYIQDREEEITRDLEETVRNKRKNVENIPIIQKNDENEETDIVSNDNVQFEESTQDTSDVVPEVNQEENKTINTSNENVDSIQISDVVALNDARVWIGKDRLSSDIYWEFGHKQMANRHMLITGTSGQGKTYSIQTMLYELAKSNISSVIFDYTEGFRLDQLEESFVDKMGSKIVQHIIYNAGVPINPFKRHEIEVSGMTLTEKTSDVALRIANIFMHVYGFGDQQFSAIFEAARVGLDKYGADMNIQYFQDELEKVKSKNNAAKTVLSKMAPFFYSIDFKDNEEFDWGEILYSEEPVINIFQLTLIDREMQVIITELMLWDAWYFTKKYGSKEKPFVVVLDEAQNLSHNTSSPSAAILTEGRKFGWSAWFATQSLKVLSDDEVVRLLQAAFKLYFKPTDDEIVRMAKQLDPTNGTTWLGALKSLKKGQCIVVGDRIKPDEKFGMVKPTITNVAPFEKRGDM